MLVRVYVKIGELREADKKLARYKTIKTYVPNALFYPDINDTRFFKRSMLKPQMEKYVNALDDHCSSIVSFLLGVTMQPTDASTGVSAGSNFTFSTVWMLKSVPLARWPRLGRA